MLGFQFGQALLCLFCGGRAAFLGLGGGRLVGAVVPTVVDAVDVDALIDRLDVCEQNKCTSYCRGS